MWFNSSNEVSHLVYLCFKKSKMNILNQVPVPISVWNTTGMLKFFESFRMGRLINNCKDLLKLCFVATFMVNNT